MRNVPRRGAKSRLARQAVHGAVTATLLIFGLLAPRPSLAQDGAPKRLTRDSVGVVYWPGYEKQARRTLDAALQPLSLPGLPAAAVVPTGTIVLAPTQARFDSVIGGRVPEWSAGVAIPDRRLIVLPVFASPQAANTDPAVTLRHELAHLAVHAYLPGSVPRWFDEGYATWISGGWDQSSAWKLRVAFLLGRAPRLDSLTLDWPAGAERAQLAYLLSASAVRNLAELGGERGFDALIAAWREQGSLDAALRSVYGMTPGHFEEQWIKVVRRRYGWLLAVSQLAVFWFVLTVLVVLAGSLRRRHNRQRMAQMEADDRWEDELRDWLADPPLPLAGDDAAASPAPEVDGRSRPA